MPTDYIPDHHDRTLEAHIAEVERRYRTFTSPVLRKRALDEHKRLVAMRRPEMQEYLDQMKP